MYALIGILILTVISTSNAQYTYRSWAPQKYVNYFVNPYISAQVEGGNQDEGNVLLTFLKNIRKEDNFQASVKYVDDKGAQISEVVKVTNLCDQLDLEMQNIQTLGFGDILGLAGVQCPILISDVQEKIDAKPFKWPTQHDFPEKISCGVHSYHATLYKCNSQGNNCKKLIEAGVESLMTSEHCKEDSEEYDEFVPVNSNSNIKVVNVSEGKIINANIQKVEVVDIDPLNGQVNDKTIDKVNVIDGKVDQVQIVNEETGDNYHIFNSEVNKVNVVNTKEENVQAIDYDGDDDDGDGIYNAGPPNVRVTQIKTKGNGVTHLEQVEDQIGDSGILESEIERDQTVDSESDNIEIEAYDGRQRSKISSNLGQIITGNRIKSNVVVHNL